MIFPTETRIETFYRKEKLFCASIIRSPSNNLARVNLTPPTLSQVSLIKPNLVLCVSWNRKLD